MDSHYEDHASLWDTQDQLQEYNYDFSHYLINLAPSIQAHELEVVF